MTKNPSGWSNPPPPDTPPPPAPPPQSPMVMQWHTGSREEFQKRAQESSDELYVALFKTLVSYGHGREVPTVAMLTALLDISHDLLINTGQLWAGARLCRRHAQGRRRPGGAAREQFRIVSNRRRLLAANVDRPSAVVFAAAARDRPPPALRSPRRHHDPDRLPARPAGIELCDPVAPGRAGHRPPARRPGQERLAERPSDAGRRTPRPAAPAA